MRKAFWIVGGVVLAGAVAVALVSVDRAPRAGIAVIGDNAPEILAAGGWMQALPLNSAGMTVVSVERWDRLRYVADMAALCGALCDGAAGLVRIVRLSPAGSDKVVLVNLSAWPDQGEAPDFRCLAAALAAEAAQITAPDAAPACAAPVPMTRTYWALPFRLGLV